LTLLTNTTPEMLPDTVNMLQMCKPTQQAKLMHSLVTTKRNE